MTGEKWFASGEIYLLLRYSKICGLKITGKKGEDRKGRTISEPACSSSQ